MSPHRVRGLDGLRGFAALSVVLFHFRWRYAGGSYLTIDVFFALSGYLITNLLLAERAKHGRIRLLRFWSRRMVRLWPPVAAGLLLAAAFAKDLSPDHTVHGFWRDAMSAGGWAMDITTSLDPGHPRPLGYTWSLGIEEQFYLLWPLILVGAIAAGLRMRELSRLAASLSAGSFVIFVLSWKNSPFLPAVYTRPDARSFAILLGCSVAIYTADPRWPGSRLHSVIAHPVAGLAALASVTAAFVLPGLIDPQLHLDPALKIGAPLVAIVTVALIAHIAARPTSPASRILSFWPIAAIGTISYSLYLVHQPVVDTIYLHHFNDLPHTGTGLLVTQVGISFAAALVLWALVERPARLLSQRIGPTVAPARRRPAHVPPRGWALVPLIGAVPILLVLAGTSMAVVWHHGP